MVVFGNRRNARLAGCVRFNYVRFVIDLCRLSFVFNRVAFLGRPSKSSVPCLRVGRVWYYRSRLGR